MALDKKATFTAVVKGDASQAITEFKKLDGQIAKTTTGASKGLDKAAVQLTKYGAAAVGAAAAAGVGLYKAAGAAGNLTAAIAANTQVLGSASTAVQKWADDSVDAVGVSKRAAIEAATAFGQLGKVAGFTGNDLSSFSTQMVTLAADMAAFKDVSPEQALQDLQSAFAGQTEVVRKYGIFLDEASLKQALLRETGEKVTGTLSAQQRVIATHAAVMQQSTDMQGQWARESDSFAAQQAKLNANLENLAAGIGKGVLPMMTQMVGTASDLVGAFSKIDAVSGGAVGSIAGIGTVALGAAGSVAFISGQVIKFRTSLTHMSPAAKAASAAIAGVTLALSLYALQQQRAAQHAQQDVALFNELSRVGDDLADTYLETARAWTALRDKSTEDMFAKLARTSHGTATRIRDQVAASADLQQQYESAGLTVDEMTAALERESAAQQQVRKDAEASTDAQSNLSNVERQRLRIMDALARGSEDMAKATEDANDALRDAVSRAVDSADAYDILARNAGHTAEAIDKVTGAGRTMASTARDWEAGVDAIDKALKDNGKTLDINTEKGRDNADAIQSQIDLLLDSYIPGLVESGLSNEEAARHAEILQHALAKQIEKFGLTEEEARDYVETLGLTPDEIETVIKDRKSVV